MASACRLDDSAGVGSIACSQRSARRRRSVLRDDQGLTVSAHVLIERAGALTQYVPFHRRAWHAGKSAYCGRTACNDFSVGIELEGADDVPYAAPRQYRSLAAVVRCASPRVPLASATPVVGHSDISPGRKTDPGPSFDWRALDALLSIASRERRQRCHSVSSPPCARASQARHDEQ